MECPVCGRKMPATFLNDHANACIDGVEYTPHLVEQTLKKDTYHTEQSQTVLSSFLKSHSPPSFLHATTISTVQITKALSSLHLSTECGLLQKRILGTNFVMDAFKDGRIDGVQFYFLRYSTPNSKILTACS